jgi:hypothetical protein
MSDLKIFPAIGIARVGDALSEYYICPEVEGALPSNPDGSEFTEHDFRDNEGRLKRQAARFKIFNGTEVVTVGSKVDGKKVAEIRWTVHLANKKSSWYEFETNKGEDGYASNHALRNAGIKDDTQRRTQLIIDAGPRSISGCSRKGEEYHFSRQSIPGGYAGNFPPTDLKPSSINTLGELQTDVHGNLLVLGGLGHSGSSVFPPSIDTYANNDNWWDDTSDGPVEAEVILEGGSSVSVDNAWVLVGPPSYAPQIANLVTLYDTIFDTCVRNIGARPDIYKDGFWQYGKDSYTPYWESDIYPILRRGQMYPWVAAIPPKAHQFDWDMLGVTSPDYRGYRQYFMDVLRGPGDENTLINATSGATMMPYLAGDDAIGATTTTQSKYLKLTDTQYYLLQKWVEGDFHPAGTSHESCHPGESMTRGVLENCVGGAFSPGIEMTWVSRLAAIYYEPFRIRARPLDDLPDPLSLDYNPGRGMEAGDVTRYMAVPWQADFNECSSQPIGDRILWWWPAQRPEFIYLDPTIKHGLAREAMPDSSMKQAPWIGTDYDQKANNYISFDDDVKMVEHWQELGFVMGKEIDGETRYVQVARTFKAPQYPIDES